MNGFHLGWVLDDESWVWMVGETVSKAVDGQSWVAVLARR